MKNVWLYCRIEQPDSDAMQMQRNDLQRYAEEHGYVVAGVTQEYGNGLSIQRFGLLDVARAVMNGKATVALTKNASRIARKSDELAQLIRLLRRYGAVLQCVREGRISSPTAQEIQSGGQALRGRDNRHHVGGKERG